MHVGHERGLPLSSRSMELGRSLFLVPFSSLTAGEMTASLFERALSLSLHKAKRASEGIVIVSWKEFHGWSCTTKPGQRFHTT